LLISDASGWPLATVLRSGALGCP